MKFVFLKSGDYLEFTPKSTKFVRGWFDYIFENEIAQKFINHEESWTTLEKNRSLADINRHINIVNDCLSIVLPDFVPFNNNFNLNQKWLNDTHKYWAHLGTVYQNELFITPYYVKESWQEINQLVHNLELGFQQDFRNSVIFEINSSANLKVEKEDCEFSQHSLVLSYDNLGRHQFNQWQVGCESVDDETNNYKSITTSFSYFQGPERYPRTEIPQEYVVWCERQHLEILPPWVILGKFKIADIWEVREIMHRNLKDDLAVGFEL